MTKTRNNYHPLYAPNGGYVPSYLLNNDQVPSYRTDNTDELDNISVYSQEALYDFDNLPKVLKVGNNVLHAWKQGYLGKKNPIQNKKIIVRTGTDNVLFELDPNCKKMDHKVGYDIERALGMTEGRVFVTDAKTGSRIGTIGKSKLWKMNGKTDFSYVVDSNQNPRVRNSFINQELSESKVVKNRLKEFSRQLNKNISSKITSSIINDSLKSNEEWHVSAKHYTDRNNVVATIASALTNEKLYKNNEGGYTGFLKSNGVIFPSDMISELSQHVSDCVSNVSCDYNLRPYKLCSTNRSMIKKKLKGCLYRLLSCCGLYRWLKMKYMKTRKYIRNYSCWRDKREDCLGRIDFSSSDDDMKGDNDYCPSSSSSDDSCSSSSSDDEIIHLHHYDQTMCHTCCNCECNCDCNLKCSDCRRCNCDTRCGCDKCLHHYHSTTRGSSYYRIAKDTKKYDPYRKTKVSVASSKINNKNNRGVINNHVYQQTGNNNTILTNNVPSFPTRSDFNNHYKKYKEDFHGPYASGKQYIIYYPSGRVNEEINLKSPETINELLENHSVLYSGDVAQSNGQNLTSISGKYKFETNSDGSQVNGKSAGKTTLLYGAKTGYKLWVKPISYMN